MKTKDKLSYQFTFLFAVLLLLVLSGVYLFVEQYRQQTFFDKLDDRAITVAKFYLAEDNLSEENFKDISKKFPQTLSDEKIRIYDSNFHPQFIPEGNVTWDIDILKKISAKRKVDLVIKGKQVAGLYYVDNSGNFIIVVSASDVTGNYYVHELGLIMIVFFLVSLIITFFLGRGFARIALMPILKITKDLKVIRSTSLDLRLPILQQKNDEINALSSAINQLLEHLEQSFESQKSFISNASHELRTPITTMLGEAEITLMRDRNSDEYKAALENILKETERLNTITNNLMELVQTNLSTSEFQDFPLDQIVWELKDEFITTKSNSCNVNFSISSQAGKSILSGNLQLLFIALSNLIKNALKFSDNQQVDFTAFCDSSGLNMVIKDRGIGILEKDIEKIFQPFFRSQNALGYPGYGIGLSLTSKIIRQHHGIISVKSVIGQGTEFSVILQYV